MSECRKKLKSYSFTTTMPVFVPIFNHFFRVFLIHHLYHCNLLSAVIPTHQTVLKSEPPRSANRRPKLLHSSLSFISNGPFLQFSRTFSDDFFRHRIHQTVLLFVTIPAQQTASNSDIGRDRTGSRKSHGEARASLSPTLMIHFPDLIWTIGSVAQMNGSDLFSSNQSGLVSQLSVRFTLSLVRPIQPVLFDQVQPSVDRDLTAPCHC
ncbi:hypothetical protein PIB30_016245 [Stylosanthes scabra]|uniref:Uncharacterized protein n=1 Tax=Stylosanthes scabra TaxID=79078 RepID=A0ABU6Y487_9FABA|nr:hypothetical protein [Stylosanthes scabra]